MFVLAGMTSDTCNSSGFTNDAYVLDTALFRWQKYTTDAGNGNGSSSIAPRRRYGPTGWWNGAAGGPQITGGTCGAACGACGHANDTFVLRAPRPPRPACPAHLPHGARCSAPGCRECGVCPGTVCGCCAAQPPAAIWAQTATEGQGPPPRDRHTSVLIGGPGVATPHVLDWGGFVAAKDYSNVVYRFDVEAARWTALA